MAYTLKNPTGKPSEGSFKYATDLIVKAHQSPADRVTALTALATANAGQVSFLIDALKASLANTPAPAPVVAANHVPGMYLVDGAKYELKIGKASGAPYLIKDGAYLGAKGTEAASVLGKIAADGQALAIAYGKKTGTCGICKITLTDPKSIAAGIGPVCAKKWA